MADDYRHRVLLEIEDKGNSHRLIYVCAETGRVVSAWSNWHEDPRPTDTLMEHRTGLKAQGWQIAIIDKAHIVKANSAASRTWTNAPD